VTSKQKVRRQEPGAFYNSIFGGIYAPGRDGEPLSDRNLPEKEAWQSAWENVKPEDERP
jgi:hypothetical protein